ncbi:unnamed protein product [Blumeria hordei]|uniref:Alpha/beta hydrolase fold-3 domain-containing protein n=1 Tax=Blumeria hordei TaxID=2867405 RepID=A0A383UJX4_BLUHO|nr:unnamed protein product [Blumeria hordei]
MEIKKRALLKILVTQAPLIVKTTLRHIFGLSEQSKYWDLRTELVIAVLRYMLNDAPPVTISRAQGLSIRDRIINGNMWVSKLTIPKPPEDDIRQVLFKAIEGLKELGDASGGYQEPDILPVEAEWTGYRAGVSAKSPEPAISEAEKFTEMMRESPTRYCDAGTSYQRTMSVHPVSPGPQNPFPAALLDILSAYLSLLYPPPDALHTPVPSDRIVFAGDSAGGNLCFSLLQVILEIQRQALFVTWHGIQREVPLPAGIATSSPWLDVTGSALHIKPIVPTTTYPPISRISQPALPGQLSRRVPTSILTNPCFSTHLCRLSRPIAGKNATGKELLSDEDTFSAMKLANLGVTVIYEEYESMPHCFGFILPKLPESKKFFTTWARTIKLMVENPEALVPSATLIKAKSLEEVTLDLQTLSTFTEEEIIQKMREKVEKMTLTVPKL